MSDYSFEVSSYRGKYQVDFYPNLEQLFSGFKNLSNIHFVIDEKVYALYSDYFSNALMIDPLLIVAKEENKDFSKLAQYVDHLLQNGIKRDHRIVAVGGGIIQDITCCIANLLFRGVTWEFIPTTLLAQCDSCIGSKSSINYSSYKNLIGSFYPPQKIYISTDFLKTLSTKDLRSGMGEIFKVNAIDSCESFFEFVDDYEQLETNDMLLQKHLYRALMIKKRFIEEDEFDQHVRNVLNYGHSFGHAIESATNFMISHGIAVTIGMDMANLFSLKLGHISDDLYQRLHFSLLKNYEEVNGIRIDFKLFVDAMSKDKKNVKNGLSVILLNREQKVEKFFLEKNSFFSQTCMEFFESFNPVSTR